MPIGRYASLRYQVLDRCFSDKRHKYTIDDLLSKVNERLFELGSSVSLRQIRDDIKHMRDRNTFDAPIETFPFDGKSTITDTMIWIFQSIRINFRSRRLKSYTLQSKY